MTKIENITYINLNLKNSPNKEENIIKISAV